MAATPVMAQIEGVVGDDSSIDDEGLSDEEEDCLFGDEGVLGDDEDDDDEDCEE